MFPIVTVPDHADSRIEQLGTKSKFWYDDTNLGLCLYKRNRVNTGEDWAEKIAGNYSALAE